MTLMSMTGFARREGVTDGVRWSIEIKSVNNKGLDVRLRSPQFLDDIDAKLKRMTSDAVSRGSLQVNILVFTEERQEEFFIHEDRLKTLIELSGKYASSDGVTDARLDGLLSLKGVLELRQSDMSEEAVAGLKALIEQEYAQALSQLATSRASEGARLRDVLDAQLDEIARLVDVAIPLAERRPEAALDKMRKQIAKLQAEDIAVSEDRLAQEIAILAVKLDVSEEIDRLQGHIEEARSLLASGKPVGRRLDFLCQEFNREANTLCSKASDKDLTRTGLDLKTVIEQLREQVQNIE